MAAAPDKPQKLRYERNGKTIEVEVVGLTNHELREILVGFWARLNEADRIDHIMELTHYHTDPHAWFSPVAKGIQANPGDYGVIDMSDKN